MSLRFFCLASSIAISSATLAQGSRQVGLLSDKDYPAEAIKRREQGTVRAHLRISPEGRVIACVIVQSATPSLDAATCRILSERARFKPKTDATGKAIVGDFEMPIRWVLPGPEPKTKQKQQGLRL